MTKKIRVIDVFAGPGGLGEGFVACKKNSPFEISMSVEMEKNAHRTLTHRAFFRRLPLRGKKELARCNTLNKKERDAELVLLKKKFSEEWKEATDETLGEPTSLGNSKIWEKISQGKNITRRDREDTEQQRKISKKIKEIRSACDQDGAPLIVIGGPPCQSYSNAGRNRVRAIEGYKPDEDQRFFLYREYARVLSEARPDVFVMENVQGMLSAKLANGKKILPQIMETLRRPSGKSEGLGYRLYSLARAHDDLLKDISGYEDFSSFLLSAEDYGVPQSRKRVIILGVRDDISAVPKPLKKIQRRTTVKDVIGSMPPIRSAITRRRGSVPDSSDTWLEEWEEIKAKLTDKLSDKEVKKYLSKLSNDEQLDLGSSGYVPANTSGFSESFDREAESDSDLSDLRKWFLGGESRGGFYNHRAKSHQKLDRMIYMFVAAFTNVRGVSPKASKLSDNGKPEFPEFLAPNHRNWCSGDFADRFRCLPPDQPGKTITSHLKKDGHAYIHYDPCQNRCLSPREAARIQSFPDDYFFEGELGAQYQQVGNAVPPYLAKKIALRVAELFSD